MTIFREFPSKLLKHEYRFSPLSVVGYLFYLLGTFVCASCLLLVVECWFLSANYRLLDVGFGVCCLTPRFRSWLLGVWCRLLVGCLLSVSVVALFLNRLFLARCTQQSSYDNCHSIFYVMYVILLMVSEEKSVIRCILTLLSARIASFSTYAVRA